MDIVSEVCYLALFMGGFSMLFVFGYLLFDAAYKYMPRFGKWVDDFIGENFDESEV